VFGKGWINAAGMRSEWRFRGNFLKKEATGGSEGRERGSGEPILRGKNV
jgi:hypothetical protein